MVLAPGFQRKRAAALTLLSICTICADTTTHGQEQQEEGTRRIWGAKFREARAQFRAKQPASDPVAGELVGVTIWRLQGTTEEPVARRATSDAAFAEGDRIQLSIEAPQKRNQYLYVIDREAYEDGSMGEPYLIFPSKSTPRGGNLVRPGKPIYVPAQGDEFPYFTFERSRKDQVRELLTIIISPKPLPLSPDVPQLLVTKLTQWEKQWECLVQRREERGGAGKIWTPAEKLAANGERRLLHGDPLPQTLYLVKTKPGAPILFQAPLKISR